MKMLVIVVFIIIFIFSVVVIVLFVNYRIGIVYYRFGIVFDDYDNKVIEWFVILFFFLKKLWRGLVRLIKIMILFNVRSIFEVNFLFKMGSEKIIKIVNFINFLIFLF